jgi:hypothetical protein
VAKVRDLAVQRNNIAHSVVRKRTPEGEVVHDLPYLKQQEILCETVLSPPDYSSRKFTTDNAPVFAYVLLDVYKITDQFMLYCRWLMKFAALVQLHARNPSVQITSWP